ncbi:MAG: tyrosine-protein phosphatase [Pseudomonadales bacterium]|nr:tyrosine-protein phosphatase [Pseudomonadales bacterium]
MTKDGIPYIYFTFDQIEKDYGSVEAYLVRELGVSTTDLQRLRSLYLI